MSRTAPDSPYRDDKSPRAAPSQPPSRPARSSNRPRQPDRPRKHQAAPSARQHPARERPAREQHQRNHQAPNRPQREPQSRDQHPRHGNGARPPQHGRHSHSEQQHNGGPHRGSVNGATAVAPASGRKRSRRRGRGKGGAPPLQLTSHPTGRAAYADTRAWLLKQHGPICAYCAREFAAETITLDHVAPRRGQTAYDRRDNLVLACRPCNEAKRDLSPLAYMLGVRSRATNLLRYGAHLSAGLLDLARSLVPDEHAHGNGKQSSRELFGGLDDDGDSPYKD